MAVPLPKSNFCTKKKTKLIGSVFYGSLAMWMIRISEVKTKRLNFLSRKQKCKKKQTNPLI